ncbi:MAG TPA: prenyltransferase/squalene oxidase repeat-containing protein [Pirellulales bacterium]|nr:prenyltransferase/squalene oxidase repeat-containing protein [Pirellulales bacterium]
MAKPQNSAMPRETPLSANAPLSPPELGIEGSTSSSTNSKQPGSRGWRNEPRLGDELPSNEKPTEPKPATSEPAATVPVTDAVAEPAATTEPAAAVSEANTPTSADAGTSETSSAPVEPLPAPVEVGLSPWRRMWPFHQQAGAWFTSAIVHATLLVILGLLVRHVIKEIAPVHLNVHTVSSDEPLLENLPTDNGPADHTRPGPAGAATASPNGDLFGSALDDTPLGVPELGPSRKVGARLDPHTEVDPLAATLSSDGGGVPWGQSMGKGGGGLGGRSPERRAQLVGSGGGSAASEAAVERGLKWLLAHQHDDGGWRFNFDGPPCDNLCRNPGRETSTTAATALALLPFYGAGYTHKEGPYTEQVNRGLYYLGTRMLATPQGGDLQEGSMYAQGLATIVLCEAYAMSKDSNLRPYAQQAVNFILYAQDRHGGGWRYFPGQVGDTSVTGWQLMALKSAQMAGLDVSSPAFFLANKFLDSVQNEKGAYYGYTLPSNGGATTTSVGLLCRMYLGWSRNHPALNAGVTALEKLGPSDTNMYFNYYATQVMYHHGGSQWERWNKVMRDYLIATQATEGHENGSWYFPDFHDDKGGRLLNTSLAILTLEVYYRYLPLYSSKAVDGGF